MANKYRKFLVVVFILSVLLNILTGIYFGRKLYLRYQTQAYTPPPKPAYYLDRDKLFEVMPADSNAIVFLGNSLTQYFELAELLQNPHVKNRGIHGDMMDGVLQRLTPLIVMQPKKIFIEMGINDLEQKIPKDTFLKKYERLIDTLKASSPATRLYVQSLLPVEDSSQRIPTYCSPEMNRLIVDVNKELKALAARKKCTYIDIHPHLLKGKQLNPAYSVDGGHLSGKGYLQWVRVVRPYVEE